MLIPKFCGHRPVSYEDIAVLWGFHEPASGGVPARAAPRKRCGHPLQSRKKASQRAMVIQLQFAQRLLALQRQKGAAQMEEPTPGLTDPQQPGFGMAAAQKFARRLNARHQKERPRAPAVAASAVDNNPTCQRSADRLVAAGFSM